MLKDAGASVLVTHSALRDRLPSEDARIVCLDTDAAAIAREPATAPPLALDPHHPAYVIYTSGSTGIPKGVVVEHGGLTNLLLVMREHVSVDRRDRLLALTSIGFDIAALELFLPLISGARLAIARKEIVYNPPAFA